MIFKYPIVFIHGFGGGKYEYQPIIKFLKQQADVDCHEFAYQKKFGEVSLVSIAREFGAFLESIRGETVDIVALSQGGVIARYAIGEGKDHKVRRCVTICAPHYGSLLAYAGLFPGIRELQPGSAFFSNLDTVRAEYYAIWNPLDLTVIPGWSGKLLTAKRTKRVISLLHPLTFSDPETLRFVSEALSHS